MRLIQGWCLVRCGECITVNRNLTASQWTIKLPCRLTAVVMPINFLDGLRLFVPVTQDIIIYHTSAYTRPRANPHTYKHWYVKYKQETSLGNSVHITVYEKHTQIMDKRFCCGYTLCIQWDLFVVGGTHFHKLALSHSIFL